MTTLIQKCPYTILQSYAIDPHVDFDNPSTLPTYIQANKTKTNKQTNIKMMPEGYKLVSYTSWSIS